MHQVIGGGPMPPYVSRRHDELLRAVLDPAVAASRLVVVRGGSSSGKSRAAYEAVAARLAGWQVDYPRNAAALAARLDAGIPARTVLWLGELRQYGDDDGGAAVLGRLADLLEGTGHVLITTVWPEHWTTYTAAARGGPGPADPAGVAGRLLSPLPELTDSDPARIDPARGGVIDVPPRFSAADLAVAARTGDPVLAAAATAAAAAGDVGHVPQYLSGVPELLDRYAGPGGDPYGQAILTAAMDAIRLGHAGPLPAEFLQQAAVGYLTSPHRTKDIASWRDAALAWATEELNGAVRALEPVPPVSGTGIAGYQIADYLDQHGRRTRQDQLGPPSLWNAVPSHAATARDQTRLGAAAKARGLYRHAAVIWTTAASRGNADAARSLVTLIGEISPDDTGRAADWAAEHVSLDDPRGVAVLLEALCHTKILDAALRLARRAASHVSLDDPRTVLELLSTLLTLSVYGTVDAVAVLLARDPASHVSLGNTQAVVELLWKLRHAGASEAVAVLLARDPASHVSLSDPRAIAHLLSTLRAFGSDQAVAVLLARDPASHVSMEDPKTVAMLLRELRQSGAGNAARSLASRAASHGSLHDPGAVGELLQAMRKYANDGGQAALGLANRAASQASVGNPVVAAWLVQALRGNDAEDAASALAGRVVSQASLDDPRAAAELLRAFRRYASDRSAWAMNLAHRAASGASLDDPRAVAELLQELRAYRADEAVAALLARDPARHVSLDDPSAVAFLIWDLRRSGDGDTARRLASRAARRASLDNPWAVAELMRELEEYPNDDGGPLATLLSRGPANHVRLDNPSAVDHLLLALRVRGTDEAVAALLSRDPASHVRLDNPSAVAALLSGLRHAGADDAALSLASRAASKVSLDGLHGVAMLLRALSVYGTDDAVATLASRAADAGMFDVFCEFCRDDASSFQFGREPDRTPSLSWRWHQPAEP